MKKNLKQIKFLFIVITVSILVIGIVSSYASSSFTTLFKTILQPQTKDVESETLNHTQTLAKTTITIIPKKSILNSTARDISNSKIVHIKPQAVDRFSLESSNNIVKPVEKSVTKTTYQGQFSSMSTNPTEIGTAGGYYFVFNAPDVDIQSSSWIQPNFDSQSSGYYLS